MGVASITYQMRRAQRDDVGCHEAGLTNHALGGVPERIAMGWQLATNVIHFVTLSFQVVEKFYSSEGSVWFARAGLEPGNPADILNFVEHCNPFRS